jgi:hypothetical protein
MDGTDIVYEDAQGVELDRLDWPLHGMTVATFKEAQVRAMQAELDAHPDAQLVTLEGIEFRLIENRSEFSRQVMGPASPHSFSAPYLYDLQPVEEISRDYYSTNVARSFRSEVWVVDAAGVETLVEYTDEIVHEVLEN